MKRKIIVTMAMGVMLAGMTAFSAMASGSNPTSEATITFQGNTNPTNPLDPADPDNGTDPGSPGTGMNGPLSLDFVPALAFGSKTLGQGTQTFDSTNVRPYIQVTDTRGTAAGWNVKAKITAFGSQAALGDAGYGTSFSGVLALKNPNIVTTATNGSTAPTAPSTVLLTSGDTQETLVLSAATGNGMNTWLDKWFPTSAGATENDSVQLTLNTDNVYASAYKAEITWILGNTP